jgi:hypothetical protein
MMRFGLLIGLLLVLTGAGYAAYGVRLAFFTVENQSRDFIITWQVDVEEAVQQYELQRRTPYSNGEFVAVQSFLPQGVSKPYRYKDDQVYKSVSEQVDYRLEVVYDNGVREVLAAKSLSYTPTAIRRTWGSIKAMFQ